MPSLYVQKRLPIPSYELEHAHNSPLHVLLSLYIPHNRVIASRNSKRANLHQCATRRDHANGDVMCQNAMRNRSVVKTTRKRRIHIVLSCCRDHRIVAFTHVASSHVSLISLSSSTLKPSSPIVLRSQPLDMTPCPPFSLSTGLPNLM